jgi:hypothetical protein
VVQVGSTAERVLQVTLVLVAGAAGRWCKTLRFGSVGGEGWVLQDTVVQQEDWCMTPNGAHAFDALCYNIQHGEFRIVLRYRTL